MMISVFDRVENIVGKRENAGYQHFLIFPQCFQMAFFLLFLKFGIVVVKSSADSDIYAEYTIRHIHRTATMILENYFAFDGVIEEVAVKKIDMNVM